MRCPRKRVNFRSHLSGTVSEPFALGDRRRVAAKVIDERGNELMRVLDVAE
jgi:adenine-specific DNA-methyltransferase